MRTRPLAWLVLLLVPAPAFAADLKADPKVGKKLLAEGDALADKKETTEAQLRYKQAFEQLLPGLRRIPFKHEVQRDVTAREDLKKVVLKDLEEDMTPDEFRTQELGMKALGFIPRDLDFKETMVQVYSEEIAAFYDPKTKTMHLIKETKAKEPSFLERLLGKTGGFDKDENKTVIAHELTHALADQNYDLYAMQKAVKSDDDRDLALAALIEGEATLAMMGAQMEDWTGEAVAKLPAKDLDRIFGFVMPLMPMFSGSSLRHAPPIFKESMLFPYIRGLVFCAHLTNEHGWRAIDDAYRKPPLSTEQILHPEKYRTAPDPPMEIDLGCLFAGPGWTEVGRNVVGEMQIGVLLQRHRGKAAAAGWDGDRYAVFEGPGRRLGLVWLTTWDSEEDAREFVRSYGHHQVTKVDQPDEGTDSDRVERRTRGEAVFLVERQGSDVAVIEGFPPETTKELLGAAFRAGKTEKTHGRSHQ